MGTNPGFQLQRRRRVRLPRVLCDVGAELKLNPRKIRKLSGHCPVHENAREVHVTGSIPEPSAHLQQSVVVVRVAREKAEAQTLKRKTSGESVTAHDHVALGWVGVIELIVRVIVQNLKLDG